MTNLIIYSKLKKSKNKHSKMFLYRCRKQYLNIHKCHICGTIEDLEYDSKLKDCYRCDKVVCTGCFNALYNTLNYNSPIIYICDICHEKQKTSGDPDYIFIPDENNPDENVYDKYDIISYDPYNYYHKNNSIDPYNDLINDEDDDEDNEKQSISSESSF